MTPVHTRQHYEIDIYLTKVLVSKFVIVSSVI